MEVIIYSAILAVFMVMAGTFLVNLLNFQARVQTQKELQQASRFLLEHLSLEIRHSRSITTIASDKIRIESENLVFTTVKLEAGVVKELQLNSVVEPDPAPYYPITDSSIAVSQLQFEKIGQSVRITVVVQKNGQSLTTISTFTSRQPLL